MRKFPALFSRLTTGHLIAFGLAAVLMAFTVVSAETGFLGLAFAGLAAMAFLGLAVPVLYTSVLSGRLERQEKRILRQGDALAARLNGTAGVYSAAGGAGGGALAPRIDAAASWAQFIVRKPRRLERFVAQAKKTRSFGARNVLAYAASRGAMDWRSLSLLLEASRLGAKTEAVRSAAAELWTPGVIALARVLFCQRIREDDLHNAMALYECVLDQQGQQGLEPVDCSYVADLLVTFGRQQEVADVLDYERGTTPARLLSQSLLRVNAVNPHLPASLSSEGAWIRSLNELLTTRGLSPLRLETGEAPAFYRVRGTASVCRVDMPLVSVIMPIFEPDRATSAAVDSLLAQSWTNLEILMVDDGSPHTDESGRPTGYRDFLEEMAARDPRIKLILNDENRGAYWARNGAYALARGKYVTVADKDDWHHPQKIEMQARDLEEHPQRPANMTQWARVDEDMRFLFRWGPDRIIHPSFASIMYRREEVQSRLGFWDSVRKSADNEFRTRLQAVYGTKIEILGDLPMAFSLLGEGNLTSQDFGLGFEQPERRIYRRSYEAWHRSIESGEASPYLEMSPADRPFLAPGSFLPERPAAVEFDVVFVSTFEYDEVEARSLAAEVRSAAGAGLRVGIIPAEAFLSRRQRISHGLRQVDELVGAGQASLTTFSQASHARLVLVRDPAILQVARDGRADMTVDRCVVRAGTGPVDTVTGFLNYDIGTVQATAENILGIPAEWIAVSLPVRDQLKRVLPAGRLLDGLMPVRGGHVDGVRPSVAGTRRPVIGRHLPDTAAYWPGNSDEFHDAYCTGEALPVQVLGSAEYPRAKYRSGQLPENWTVVDDAMVAVPQFLAGLDFLVHFPHPAAGQNGLFEVAEAMAHGVVCILPPGYRSVFGGAAVYCAPADTAATIEQLWNDPKAYEAMQGKGRAAAAEAPACAGLPGTRDRIAEPAA